MRILYIGDIYGDPGMDVVGRVLPDLKREKKIDLVIAQSENVSGGKGMLPSDRQKLQEFGVDFFTGGNWSLFRKESHSDLENENIPSIRPANYPEGTPGRGWKYIDTREGRVLVISLLGSIVGKDSEKPKDNPLKVIDQILQENQEVKRTATVVNLHGDFSSEKRIIGYYLDGKVSLVVGDHWHVPTADAMVLPKGTAHITDVGMCGALHSSLGVKLEVVINRWRNGVINKNEAETSGPLQFNAVLAEVDKNTGLAHSASQIQKILN